MLLPQKPMLQSTPGEAICWIDYCMQCLRGTHSPAVRAREPGRSDEVPQLVSGSRYEESRDRRIIGVQEYRDGTVIDVLRQVASSG